MRAILVPLAAASLMACSKAPPTFVSPPALPVPTEPPVASVASTTPVDAGGTDAPAAGERQAKRIDAKDLELGPFAVAAEPSSDHPMGVVAALGWPKDNTPDVYAVAIDVAGAREINRVRIGPTEHDGTTMIAHWPHGVVVANQSKSTVELTWITDGLVLGAHQSVPGLGVDQQLELRGFKGFDDRLVLASTSRVGDGMTTTLRIVDDKGSVLSTHGCHGGLHAPGDAYMVRRGDAVVLMNLNSESGFPVCAGHLHGAARWRDVKLSLGRLDEHDGIVYFTSDEQTTPGRRVLGDDLRPTGPSVPQEATPQPPLCTGLTGTAAWQEEVVGGASVIHTISCCGDPSPGGLFVCPPAS